MRYCSAPLRGWSTTYLRYYRTKDQPVPQPAVAYALARETHDSDLTAGAQTKIQHSFVYSDGFGREIQKKIQAEPGPVVEGGSEIAPRWVGTGWTVFNNKGKARAPVRAFLHCDPPFRIGRAGRGQSDPVLRSDRASRRHAQSQPYLGKGLLRSLAARDLGCQRHSAGRRSSTTPTSATSSADYQIPITCRRGMPQRIDGASGIQEQAAARKSRVPRRHSGNRPYDSLGRTFLTVAHNKFESTASDGSVETVEESYPTRIVLDIEGNQREVIDAKDRVVMRYDYDMLGSRIHSCQHGGRRALDAQRCSG